MSAGTIHKSVLCLFSGGDAPGMNPLLRALVRVGLNRYGARVLGVKDGYAGLVRTCRRIREGFTASKVRAEIARNPGSPGLARRGQDLVLLNQQAVSGLIGCGGIVLGSARCPEFLVAEHRLQVADLLDKLEVDAVVVCGGDGSLAGARLFAAECRLQTIGVPATIDNDVTGTDMSLGVDTATNTLMDAIERVSDTTRSHHRIMVLETMGRGSGELARRAAVASGAEIVVTPERGALTRQKMSGIADRLEKSMHRGRNHAIVIVAEGVTVEPATEVGPAQVLGSFLQSHFAQSNRSSPPPEVRVNILGHLQRGGRPTAADRILASRFADAAWDAIAQDEPMSGMLAVTQDRIHLRPFVKKSRTRRMTGQGQRLYRLQKTLSQW